MNPTPALALLTAMLTPAVLISACGLLIMSTSTRLTRVVDRVRSLCATLEGLFGGTSTPVLELRRKLVEEQLELLTERGRLIQRALTSLYLALGIFVATILSIALVAFVAAVAFLPTALGLLGTCVLLFGCLSLIRETRLAVRSIDLEMGFVLALREAYARSQS